MFYNFRAFVISLIVLFSAMPGFTQLEEYSLSPAGYFGGVVKTGAVQGDYAYLSQGQGISVIDISRPVPERTGYIGLPELPLDIVVDGAYLYTILQNNGGFYVIDISDPSAPDSTASLNVPTHQTAGLALKDPYVHIAAERDGWQVVDISDPSSPDLETVPLFYPSDIQLQGNAAYALESSASPARLRLFDMTNPLDPVFRGQVQADFGKSITVSGNTAYVTCSEYLGGQNGLRIIDVSDMRDPFEKHYYPTRQRAFNTFVNDGTAFMGLNEEIHILDISNTPPALLSKYPVADANEIRCIGLSGHFLYITVKGADRPLQKIDISDPASPSQHSAMMSPDNILSALAADDMLYLSTTRHLFLYSLANPVVPARQQSFARFGNLAFLQRHENLMTGADWNRFVILDNSNPLNPRELGAFTLDEGLVMFYAVHNNTAYIQSSQNKLIVLDIAVPQNPGEIKTIALAGTGRRIDVDHPLLYSAFSGADNGIEIFDISQPAEPSKVTTIDLQTTPTCLWVKDKILYAGGNNRQGEYSLQMFDISDPASPQSLAELFDEGHIWDMDVINGLVLAAVEGGSVIGYLYNEVAGELEKTDECHSPGSLQITTTPQDDQGRGTLYTVEGEGFMMYAGRSQNLQIKKTMGMVNTGSKGIAVQEFRTPPPPPENPVLTLGKNSNPTTGFCPCPDEEKEIFNFTLTADNADNWELLSVKIKAFGWGHEQRDIKRAILYYENTKTDSGSYSAEDGMLSFSLNEIIQAGTTVHLRLTYLFNDSCLNTTEIVDYGAQTQMSWIGAEPVQHMGTYEKLPPAPVSNDPVVFGPVWNTHTSDVFATIQESINDKDTRDGHMIQVCPGIYVENVDVSKSLTVKSVAGRSVTIIQSPNSDQDVVRVRKSGTVIDGFSVERAADAAGVYVAGGATGCSVLNNDVNHNQTGIVLDAVSGTSVTANRIRFNVRGLEIINQSSLNIIGGNRHNGEHNIISGNEETGLLITGAGTMVNKIHGNLIGTGEDGNTRLMNRRGILISSDADSNIIGSTEKGYGNVISGNEELGMQIETARNRVTGNVIGLGKDGACIKRFLLTNQYGIILTRDAQENVIGPGNIIAGNYKGELIESAGIMMVGGNTVNNVVKGNYIGTADGTHSCFNKYGIYILNGASDNLIGGKVDEDRNIITGNFGAQIYIRDPATSGNRIIGNYIGLGVNGNTWTNAGNGINIYYGAHHNIIGGTSPGERNVISGNAAGISMGYQETSNNTVIGNYIGTDKTGYKRVRNLWGLEFYKAGYNKIGGQTPEERNIISGSDYVNVLIKSSRDLVITGNYIGPDRDGTHALSGGVGVFIAHESLNCVFENNIISGNKEGVRIYKGSSDNILTGNLIGVDKSGRNKLSNLKMGVTIKGLETAGNRLLNNVISGNKGAGVIIDKKANENVIAGNKIGTDLNGRFAVGNGSGVYECGVSIRGGAFNNTVGGAHVADRNIISGNRLHGIEITGAGTNGNKILNNYIGTNGEGTAAVPNLYEGIYVTDGAGENVIGHGPEPGGNLVSGNAKTGIRLNGSGTQKNTIRGNKIGTAMSGAQPLPNGDSGIALTGGAHTNTIGGARAGEGNLISGNAAIGVALMFDGVDNNILAGNFIGTDVTGTRAIPNGSQGIMLFGGPQFNIIGGMTPEEKNLISGNTQNGITLFGAATAKNKIFGNLIGTDVTGAKALANKQYGIHILEKAGENIIGGTEDHQGNTISGNTRAGIVMDQSLGYNLVAGNYIGTDRDGKNSVANGAGVRLLRNSDFNRIEDNVIAGNAGAGLDIVGSKRNKVLNNLIGTGPANTGLPNTGNGVIISGGRANFFHGNTISGNIGDGVKISNSQNNILLANRIGTGRFAQSILPNTNGITLEHRAAFNRIGSTEKNSGNTIAGNRQNGVRVSGMETANNKITGNIIGTNQDDAADVGNGKNGVAFLDSCRRNLLAGNKIWYNCTGILEENSGNDILINSIRYNTCSTGIHSRASSSRITGNSISNDRSDAIVCKDGSGPTIANNNIYDNAGAGLRNADAGVTLTATDNWWGHASGPGGEGTGNGQDVLGAVDYKPWLQEPVSLIASMEKETLYLPPGAADSVYCTIQNWQDLQSVYHINISDSLGWPISPREAEYRLNAPVGAAVPVHIRVPEDAVPGTVNKITAGISSGDAGENTETEIHIHIYRAHPAFMTVSPDSTSIYSGESVQFSASVFDSLGKPLDCAVSWDTPGGVITSTGVCTAGETPGLYRVTAKAAGSEVQGTAVLHIRDAENRPARIVVEPGFTGVRCGASKQFRAIGYNAENDSVNTSSVWSCSGGTIDDSGLYTADTDSGQYYIFARDTVTGVSDYAVAKMYPHLQKIQIQPDTVPALGPGAQLPFSAWGTDTLDQPVVIYPVWTTDGGTVDSTGLFTAGAEAGFYHVWVRDLYSDKTDSVRIQVTAESAVSKNPKPSHYALLQNYPNPFNPLTTIEYSVPEACRVKLTVYNIRGRIVRRLVDGKKSPGHYKAVFDAGQLATGVYFYRIQMQEFRQTRKMVLLE